MLAVVPQGIPGSHIFMRCLYFSEKSNARLVWWEIAKKKKLYIFDIASSIMCFFICYQYIFKIFQNRSPLSKIVLFLQMQPLRLIFAISTRQAYVFGNLKTHLGMRDRQLSGKEPKNFKLYKMAVGCWNPIRSVSLDIWKMGNCFTENKKQIRDLFKSLVCYSPIL